MSRFALVLIVFLCFNEASANSDLLTLANTIHSRYQHGYKYMDSEIQYGAGNYWPTREETRSSHKADCKGFAVAAYYDMLDAGVPEDQLYIWVVRIKKTGELHAVLVAGDYIVDRMVDQVFTVAQGQKVFTNVGQFSPTKYTKY